MADQGPDADVKLSLSEKQGSFNVLLHDERVVLDLPDAAWAGRASVWVCLVFILRDLA